MDESEIQELINYFDEIMKNSGHNLDTNLENKENKENKEESQEKCKNNLSSLIILILFDYIVGKNNKNNFNIFYNELNKNELNDCQILTIINELINIFSNNLDSNDMSVIKNINNINPIKKSSSSNITSESFNYMNFYEDLFDIILLLLKKKFYHNEGKINNKMIQNNKEEKKYENINKNINQINMIKHDKIKLDLINLIFFVEEMISAHINNHNIQITTLYCLINLIKFIHIITFDDKLIDLYKEDKYLIFLKVFLSHVIILK